MNHFEWVLPVVLGVWFLISLLRKTEEERRNRERERERAAGPSLERPQAPPKKRLPPSDIDRFLEEVNRRRRQETERPPRAAAPTKPTATPPRPRPATASRPVPTSKPPVAMPPLAAVPVEEPMVAVAIKSPAAAFSWPEPGEKGAATTGERLASRAGARSSSPVLAQLVTLLRSQQSLRTAMLLHEIFGSPKCRRR